MACHELVGRSLQLLRKQESPSETGASLESSPYQPALHASTLDGLVHLASIYVGLTLLNIMDPDSKSCSSPSRSAGGSSCTSSRE
eukprot:3557626-Amphidinium_carterae.2